MRIELKPKWTRVVFQGALFALSLGGCGNTAVQEALRHQTDSARQNARVTAKAAATATQAPQPTADIFFEDLNPERGSGYTEKQVVRARNFMVASANPLATDAGYLILAQGGSAMDAAIAAQLVLSLVEPQSSGIGGGAFALYYNNAQNVLTTYDGRETAPAAAAPARFMSDDRSLPFKAAVNSGLSVGVPGLLRMLEMAHRQQGTLPWAALFQPAIQLGEGGFKVSPRLNLLVSESKGLAEQEAAAAYFMDGDGKPWPVGHLLKNPEFAQVLRAVATDGADAFYTGEIAQDIVGAVRGHPLPGDLTLGDLAGYEAKQREPVCGDYRIYSVCGMAPPSAGGIGVIQMLGILAHFPMKELGPVSAQAVHYFSEAGRLAYADRDYYVADPDFVDLPTKALIAPRYLKERAELIRPDRSLGTAMPGDPGAGLVPFGRDNALETPSTSHIVAVDAQDNVVSMTTSVESAFGSKIFVRGFLLNNQLTDFSHNPVDEDDNLVANRVEPGKRPRSTMAPTIVFKDGRPFMAVGSPGGSAIINYVAKTLVGVLDWELDVQEAISLPNFGSRNKQTELEKGRGLEEIADTLRAMGHVVMFSEYPSGIQGIVVNDGFLQGGADPRREGGAKGG